MCLFLCMQVFIVNHHYNMLFGCKASTIVFLDISLIEFRVFNILSITKHIASFSFSQFGVWWPESS